jgi:uncharacterized repeat protein (TIGR01451 family)
MKRALAPTCLVVAFVATLGLAAVVSAAPSGSSDLRITKTASAGSVNVGSTLTYTIGVQNLGPDPVGGVTVTDQLPKQVDPVSTASTLGQCATQKRTIVCKIGGLEFGPSAISSSAGVTVTVVVRRGGKITNTASVNGDLKDPVQSNDKASVTVTGVNVKPAPRATCRGFAANVVGTPHSDLLTGTPGRDVIAALGGNDTIVALSGRDLVCAGRGNDVVTGGPAADRVSAGGGRDRVLGRGGPDVLRGLGGADVLKGNAGADRLRGGLGFDRCRGGAGLDSLRSCERR